MLLEEISQQKKKILHTLNYIALMCCAVAWEKNFLYLSMLLHLMWCTYDEDKKQAFVIRVKFCLIFFVYSWWKRTGK